MSIIINKNRYPILTKNKIKIQFNKRDFPYKK